MPANFKEITGAFSAGTDYSITLREGKLQRTFMVAAIHGGQIEPHTSEIAARVAGDQNGLYLFEGWKKPAYQNFHITSNEFDEPQFNEAAATYERIVTIHGCTDQYGPAVILGGRDIALVYMLAKNLRDAGIDATDYGPFFQALSIRNVCNRSSLECGAQIEIPRALRDNAPARTQLIQTVAESLAQFDAPRRTV